MKRFRVLELFLIAILVSGSVLAASLDIIVGTDLIEPFGVTVDVANTIYITDAGNNRIIKYLPDTGAQSIYAGSPGASGRGLVNGPALSSKFSNPQGIVAARGGLFVADGGNNLIRFVSSDGLVSTIAGSSVGQADGPAAAAQFNSPAGLAADQAGNVFIADMLNGAIRRLDTNNQVSTLSSGLLRPAGVAVTPDGLGVFVADSGNHSIYAITNGVLSLIAGSGTRYGSGYKDAAVGKDALFNAPRGILWGGDAFGLLVSDSGNHLLRQITYNASDKVYSVSTFAFTGSSLVLPIGLSQTLNGGFLVVDSGANSLRGFIPTQTAAVADPAIGYIDESVNTTDTNLISRSFIQITNSTFFNDVVIAIKGDTAAQTYFTLDSSDPSVTNGTTAPTLRLDGTTKSIIDSSFQSSASNILVKAISIASGRRPSAIVSAHILFQVANPSVKGTEPAHTSLASETKGAVLYYTINGTDPGPDNGIRYLAGSEIDFGNLSTNVVLKVRAFRNGYAPSGVVLKSLVFNRGNASACGVYRDFTAGIGTRLLIPVEIHLRADDILKTIQYRIEITGNGVPISSLSTLPVTTNDVTNPLKTYAQIFDAPDLVVNYSLTNGTGLLVGRFRAATNAFSGGNFLSTIVSVPIPTNAQTGQTYTISVLDPSGTSDGTSLPVPFIASTNHTITVTNIPYVVGDSARVVWYSAGEFGNGNLNNNDVLTAFQASVGFINVFEGTDLFDALDASPEDSLAGPGGDGLISLADWNVIFQRSLRLKPANYLRVRIPGGGRSVIATNLNDLPDTAADSLSALNGNDAWVAHGNIKASTVENANPGEDINVPLSLNMFGGLTVSGAQFRADIVPMSGAPVITDPLVFVPASGFPNPPMTTALPGAIGCGWPLGSFLPELHDATLIGSLRFKLPATAVKGQSYLVRLTRVDASRAGADGSFTPFHIESIPAAVWVQSPSLQVLDIISDDWKIRFFGDVASPLALPGADPDGDGKTNLQEFLTGTNPVKLRFHGLDQDWRNALSNGFKLRWFAANGKSFVIEMSSDMLVWQTVAVVNGMGGVQEVTAPRTSPKAQYFRIRTNP